jgi:hypothetical protein
MSGHRRARPGTWCETGLGVRARRPGHPSEVTDARPPGEAESACAERLVEGGESKVLRSLRCPGCGSWFDSLEVPDHIRSGCFLGILVGVLTERDEIAFGDRTLFEMAGSRLGINWLWEGFVFPAADALEDVLLECGAEPKGSR